MAWSALAALSLAAPLACLPSLPASASGPTAPDLESLDRGLYEASGAVAPRHPVTGRPVFNVVPEGLEIRLARDFWAQYEKEARERGAAVDPRGPRLSRIRSLFTELTAVAHRPQLPWEAHLVEDAAPNAFTAGGGLVVVLSGLFDSGMVEDDDPESLAAVLAHEVAHVALLHPPTRVTWLGVGGVVSPGAKDPYYRAAYTLEQEAEADRLSVLYLALAGIDPLSAARLWSRVAERFEESPGRAGYLHDHPVNAERVWITREAARKVAPYRKRGRNPNARAILADNVLYPRAPEAAYRPGDGVARAATAMIDSFRLHQRASRSRDARRAAASAQAQVRVIGTWDGSGPDGGPGLVLDVWNGADRVVDGLSMSLGYWSRGALVYLEDCHAEVLIAPRSTRTVRCTRQGVEADRIEPRVTEVSWR
ncbi:MAG: M48 family metallopeptidase [Deltaproteobacteria bacterium]|nr:M48 family metallopeptidase [Deltaproteobacteria bacterium]MBW2445347.1 M48 family metallopeptidase [Deltaproteobacteria bacterium]